VEPREEEEEEEEERSRGTFRHLRVHKVHYHVRKNPSLTVT
jgi:hypothetical protein